MACSGGADSLALAAATAFVAPRLGLAAGAVVVDHGLQPDSAMVAERAAESCRGLGLDPVEVVRVDVGRDGGPEGAARAARRTALETAAARHRAVAVLVGHTLDDQAETVLLGLARGSGARSLSGMRPADGLWRRPLLGVRRTLTRRACADQGLQPWDDPHNSSADFTRVRVRQRAMPVLEDELGPGMAEALARTAALLQADADLLDELAWKALTDRCDELARLHPALRSRVLRLLAIEAGCPAGSLSSGHIGALDALVESWHGQGPVALPGGLSGLRRCGTLTFVTTLTVKTPSLKTSAVQR
ncbi:MAG: tRNA(Ile)-lysidine synthase [Frankiales bacterium]|nr:tRNA(Ile)-lysidine synthase [Frankiales bacterium]